jgi:polysaccharide export outer membrane protein
MPKTHRFSAQFRVIPWLIIIFIILPSLYAQTDYPIGAGDLLSIDVLGVPDFTRELRVNASGNIPMPFLGPVSVKGLTPAQAGEKIADLLNPDYVKNPQVSILIKDPRSRTFSVIGAVQKPDQYKLEQPITLVAAIAGAGGLNFAKASEIAQVQRLHENGDSTYQIEVNLKKLLYEGDLSRDIPIKPGDVINIPVRADTSVYVIGDVNKPGPCALPEDQAITVSRALAMAGGPTKTSKMKSVTLIRQLADGKVDRQEIDLGKIIKGKNADIAMQPNDMLFVPGSVGKSLSMSILQTIPSMLTYGILRY